MKYPYLQVKMTSYIRTWSCLQLTDNISTFATNKNVFLDIAFYLLVFLLIVSLSENNNISLIKIVLI